MSKNKQAPAGIIEFTDEDRAEAWASMNRKPLAELCIIIDHLEEHGLHHLTEPFTKRRDAILAPPPPQQSKGKGK